MIEQSIERMDELVRKDSNDIAVLKLQQKEFEMQLKLLDKIVKNWKEGEGFVEITRKLSKIEEVVRANDKPERH
jgi:hypothetical protein